MGARADDLVRRGGEGGEAQVVEFRTSDVARKALTGRIAWRDIEHRLADGVVPVGELLARTDSVGRPIPVRHRGPWPPGVFGLHLRPRLDALRTKTRHRQYGE